MILLHSLYHRIKYKVFEILKSRIDRGNCVCSLLQLKINILATTTCTAIMRESVVPSAEPSYVSMLTARLTFEVLKFISVCIENYSCFNALAFDVDV